MIKRLLSFVLLVSLTFSVFAQSKGYYDSATGTGYTLKTQLYNIINDHIDLGYGGLWITYQTSDRDYFYENDGTILDMYSENPSGVDPYNYAVGTGQCGTYSIEGDCYNREHIIPQSIFNENPPMVSDAHFITPTDGKVNGMRSNFPHGVVGTATYTSKNGSKLGPGLNSGYASGYSGKVFEPLDDFKGDIARMYFYFATRYENVITTWGNSYDMFNGSSDQVFAEPFLTILLTWNTQDPVSASEIARNNAIYARQGNRNPFIDHPEYVNEIWGGGTTTLSFTSSSVSTATQGQPYSFAVKTTGPNVAAITITNTTLLPAWLTLSGTTNGNATLSGTPVSAGSFNFELSATDGTTTKTQSFTITVAALDGLKFNSTPVSSATTGSSYSYSVVVTNQSSPSATITLSAPTKPSWLTLTSIGNGTATLSGTPSTAGADNVTLAANDGTTTVNQNFTITVEQGGLTKTETFENMPLPEASSYVDFNWIGDNGIQWFAVQARNDLDINGRAICFKKATGTSLTSQEISGGCSSISFKHKQMFSTVGGELTLFINEQQIGQPVSVTATEQTATYNGLLITGNVVIKLVSNGATQIGIDDVTLAGYSNVNALPTVSNITNNPFSPTTDDDVLITAKVSDSDGTISSVELKWGLTEGNLSNILAMSLDGDVYKAAIPKQAAGTVYLSITAKDNSDATSTEFFSYDVVENIKPTISNIANIPASPFAGQSIKITADIADADGSIEDAWLNWGTSATALNNQLTLEFADGKYEATIPAQDQARTVYVKISARDDMGGVSTSTYNFAVTQNQLPTISNFAINPTSPTTGQAITVSVNLADADGNVQDAWIDWGTSANSLTNKVNLSLSAGVYSCTIPAQSSAGTIYLAVTVKDNVQASSTASFNFNVTPATGIDENQMNRVKIYPNPAKNIINIEINEQKASTITVSNIIGETMIKVPYNGGKQPVDISMLKSGVYFVIVSGDGFKNTVRILKY